jgi:hypothetical protein
MYKYLVLKSMKSIYVFAIVSFLFSCDSPVVSQNKNPSLYETEAFKNYWYRGKAEVNSYDLLQSRYGEVREGKSMLLFVTEDFSKKKQVKLDDPDKAGNDKVSVLKMNFTKNFVTGIYPYSMMLSVFTPISRNQFPNTLKTTMSSQEWCGHVFTQLNLQNKRYNLQSHSYFEKEADENGQLKVTWLEDELWNLIRLEPEKLPMGKIEIIPGLFFSRLLHVGLAAQQAMTAKDEGGQEVVYTISIPAQNHSLSIRYQKDFPHKILGWEENFIERGKTVQTKAVLDKTLYIDYWTKNRNESIGLRDSLGLSHKNY